MKKIHMVIAALLAFLPTALWAGSANNYARLTAKVSTQSSGRGMVYADKSSVTTPGTFAENSQTQQGGSDCANQSYTFKVFAQAKEGYEFTGWSETDGGTIIAQSNVSPWTPPAITAPNGEAPKSGSKDYFTDKTYYANFQKMVLASFNITFEISSAGTYTVDGATPANKTGLEEATSVVLKSTDANFLNWLVNETVVNDNPYTVNCLADTTISAEFLTADQVTSVTTLSDLTSALSNAAYKKIIVPSGTTLTVAKGSTVTVPDGKLLVVDGMLYVEGSLKVSGTVKGIGKVLKHYMTVTQDTTIYEPYGDVKYMKTSTISGSGSITGTVDCESGWSVKVMRGDEVIARSELSSQQPQALVCPVDSAKAINYFTSGTVTGYDTLAKAIMGTGGNASKIAVQLANATMQLSDFPKDSGWRATSNSQPQEKLGAKAMRVDSVGFECTTKFEQANSSGTSFECFINCKKFENGSGGYFTNAKGQFINCASVKPSLNLNGEKYTSRAEIYDCGTVEFKKSGGNYDIVSNGGGYYYMSGGPYAGRSGYVNDISKNIRASGGCFTEDPTNYKSTADLQVKKIGDYWYVADSFPEEPVQTMVVKVGESEYPSLEDAITQSASGSVIEVMDSFEISGNIEIPEGKTLEIELAGFNVTGNATIVNNGTLIIGDGSVYEDGKGDFVPSIVNNGTLSLCYGDFTGSITLNAGSTTTFYNGNFNGALTVNDGADVNLLGGCFKQSVEDLLSEGYRELRVGSNYYAGKIFEAAVTDTTKNGYEAAYTLKAVDSEIAKVYGYSNLRSEYTDDAKWYEHAATCASIDPFSGWTIDCTVAFDRATKAGTVNFWYLYDDYLDRDLAAGEVDRCMSPIITAHNSYQISYGRFIHNDPVSSVTVAARNNTGDENAVNNLGTVCTIEMRIYESTRSDENYLTLAQRRFTLGAGTNKAMIRPETGAATFYAKVSAALAAVEDGGTVMLANDSADDVVFAKVGTYTIDANGFAFSGSVTAAEGFTVASQGEGVYVVTSNPAAKIDVETVVSQVVSEEWLEANEISTDGKTDEEVQAAVQDVLNVKDTNGNAKWENLVIGQKADEAAAVTAANGGTETTVDVAVTFEVPKDETTGDKIYTGYTVKYAFDKVDISTGDVVENGAGEANEAPTLNFEEVAVNEPTYFKMRAVLEASDKSGVTAAVPVEKTIGVVKVASDAEVTIIPVPWQSLGNGDIKASELVHAASLSNGDELIVYGTDGKPQTWIVKNGEWTAPAAEYTIGGGDSEPQQVEKQDPAELKRGQGVILKRKDTKKEIVLIGQPVTETEAVETPIAAATDDEPSWNLVASPNMAEVDISEAFTEEKGNTSDEIIVPTAGTPKHYTYKNNAWGYTGKLSDTEVTLPDGTKTKAVQFGHKTDDQKVPAGTGFWYLNKDSSNNSKTIAW